MTFSYGNCKPLTGGDFEGHQLVAPTLVPEELSPQAVCVECGEVCSVRVYQCQALSSPLQQVCPKCRGTLRLYKGDVLHLPPTAPAKRKIEKR
jgi:predicted RNA-binding Zn-ribbon protein involved in translation (DUF1610 family)